MKDSIVKFFDKALTLPLQLLCFLLIIPALFWLTCPVVMIGLSPFFTTLLCLLVIALFLFVKLAWLPVSLTVWIISAFRAVHYGKSLFLTLYIICAVIYLVCFIAILAGVVSDLFKRR